jgi:DNA polymerase-1
MKTELIIDGDIVVFQACAASEKATKWDDELWTLQTDEGEAKHKAHQSVERIIKSVKGHYPDTSTVLIAFSAKDNFRKEVYPDYKANRVKKRKPLCIPEVVAYLGQHYTSEIWPKIEADDVMGIWATSSSDTSIIYSADKDMATIPGCIHIRNLDDAPVEITQTDADRNWFTQALTGDSVDNYHGVKGIGPVKAKRILAEATTEKEMWELTLKAFVKAGYTQGECLTQVRLARILRAGDYTSENEVVLWSPADEY